EHNLDVLKTADWLIDLGPEGGREGGKLVAAGTPEQVATCAASYTGQALEAVLAPKARSSRTAVRGPAKPKRAANGDGRITHISVEGAAEHNLKHIDLSMPRDAMTVCCGPSGSGKSSLAIDTVYA